MVAQHSHPRSAITFIATAVINLQQYIRGLKRKPVLTRRIYDNPRSLPTLAVKQDMHCDATRLYVIISISLFVQGLSLRSLYSCSVVRQPNTTCLQIQHGYLRLRTLVRKECIHYALSHTFRTCNLYMGSK